uniref:CUB and zona pellucida-like domains 1, tandem duplicate 1 n=1 Tax=Lepisosteus oculatus TaxID=7918 RepID=W5MNU8_LEPOC
PFVSSCGGNLEGPTGWFASPNFPDNYPNYSDCIWYITVQEYETILLEFREILLEISNGCVYDSISVYDGPSTSSTLLGIMCQNGSFTFQSSSNSLTVAFKSDYSVTAQGFLAQYQAVSPELLSKQEAPLGQSPSDTSFPWTTYPSLPQLSTETAWQCGGTLTQSRGQFTSPNYPQSYPNNAHCTWNIRASGYRTIYLEFSYFLLETTPGCGYDRVSVYDGPSSSYPLLGRICGGQKRTYNSTRNYMTVVFESDSSSTYKGFEAFYSFHDRSLTATSSYCGGNLGGSSGSFSSPNYPNNYNNGANCIWHITVPNGQKVFLTFTDFELESCGSCGCDSVSIYDGRTSSSPLIAKICQNTTSDSYHSTSHYMTVVFRTDGSAVRKGFRAIYSSTVPVYGEAQVECSSDAMRVIIQNSYLDSMGLTGNDLYLNDQYCRPVFSSSHVTFNVPLNSCGTVREDSRGRITYINDVRAFVSSSGEITRQSHMQLRVGCRMQQDTMVQIMYVARERVTGNITGSGNYNVKMAFYTSSNFYYPVTMSPYVVDLNQFLYVQAQLQSSDSNLVIFLDTCVASPSPTDFLTRTYDLIRDGCRKDSSFYSYVSGTSTVAQFRFSAFKFIRSHPSVYLQCRIAVCNAYDNYSRCKQGCQPRKRRDLSSSHEKTTVVLGPIQLRDPTKPDKETLVQAIV